jgi:hypothetical protein
MFTRRQLLKEGAVRIGYVSPQSGALSAFSEADALS